MKPEDTEKLFIESMFKQSKLSEEKPEIEKLTGDASTRKYFRLKTTKETYVICLDDPIAIEEKYPFEEMQEVLQKNNIRVPKIFFSRREKGFLVEEDLGDETLLEYLGQARNESEIKNLYYPVIDQLLKIHKINSKDYKDLNFTKMRFDHAKLIDETRLTNLNFLIKLLGTPEDNHAINLIDQSFSKICKFLDTGPWVVTHRDFHSRNIMIKNGESIVIDFQDARLGLVQYDLVSLLEDCYFFVSDKSKQDLINYYLERSDLTLESFEKYYDMMAIQRLYKALGSFAYIYNTRGDSRYLKFIGRSFERIQYLLSKHTQFEDLKLALAKIYYAS